jgi:hypothetical protein
MRMVICNAVWQGVVPFGLPDVQEMEMPERNSANQRFQVPATSGLCCASHT